MLGTQLDARLHQAADKRNLIIRLEVSRRIFQYAQMPAGEIAKTIGAYGQEIAVLPPQEVESIVASSGFAPPVLFFQTVLIHAWCAKRTQ
jgi:tRNA (cmo5U34)-methyltransferase